MLHSGELLLGVFVCVVGAGHCCRLNAFPFVFSFSTTLRPCLVFPLGVRFSDRILPHIPFPNNINYAHRLLSIIELLPACADSRSQSVSLPVVSIYNRREERRKSLLLIGHCLSV